MGLFKEWETLANKERSQEEYNEFWKSYLEKEQKNYEKILENSNSVFEGNLSELAAQFGMNNVDFTGFIYGVNTSLIELADLGKLEEDSQIKLAIDFEKLYFNMLDAKADWLYTLPQWDNILTLEKRKEITNEYRKSKMAVSNKIGRNDSCPCGSGQKYKKCCGK